MRSIICTTQSIQGILDKSKTQTRRVCKTPPVYWQAGYAGRYGESEVVGLYSMPPKNVLKGMTLHELALTYCPFGVPGDKLWVRESFWHYGGWENYIDDENKNRKRFVPFGNKNIHIQYYQADSRKPEVQFDLTGRANWYKRPSIYMPKWASRITLKIEDIKLEQVQEITDKDIIAEGVPRDTLYGLGYFPGNPKAPLDKREGGGLLRGLQGSFARLWDSINHYRGFGWPVNPWVWVIIFSLDNMENENE